MDTQQGTEQSSASDSSVDPIKQLLAFARADRERNPVLRSPVITEDSPGVKLARALQTARKYGIKV